MKGKSEMAAIPKKKKKVETIIVELQYGYVMESLIHNLFTIKTPHGHIFPAKIQ